LLSLTPVDFTESYRSNVIGAVLCSLAAVPIMNRDGGGSIIHISSGAGRRATSELRWALGVSRSA
ncbi:MAG: SDR family NAD(P)-dependent oxidoreductase, partial [Acidimicrobiaceae bacterium]|nr:SDR family NAD(P)-dependent oxidoreductase [Acidimicrobiaceae bacterium]